MRKHPERLKQAGISPARYLELQAVCRDYPRYRRQLQRARAGIVDRPSRGSGAYHRPDPTAAEAMFLAAHPAARRVKLIEDCAACVVEPCVVRPLLRCVSENLTWEQLQPPMGRNQFYHARLAFFIALDAALGY